MACVGCKTDKHLPFNTQTDISTCRRALRKRTPCWRWNTEWMWHSFPSQNKWRPQTSHQPAWKDTEASPCSPGIANAWTLRTGTSWHCCVIVAENGASVSQVYSVSSMPLTKNNKLSREERGQARYVQGCPFYCYICTLCLFEYSQVCIKNEYKWMDYEKTNGQQYPICISIKARQWKNRVMAHSTEPQSNSGGRRSRSSVQHHYPNLRFDGLTCARSSRNVRLSHVGKFYFTRDFEGLCFHLVSRWRLARPGWIQRDAQIRLSHLNATWEEPFAEVNTALNGSDSNMEYSHGCLKKCSGRLFAGISQHLSSVFHDTVIPDVAFVPSSSHSIRSIRPGHAPLFWS